MPLKSSIALGAGAVARTWQRLGVLAALVLLVIAASFLSHRFLTVPNLLNVLRQVSIVGILAIGGQVTARAVLTR